MSPGESDMDALRLAMPLFSSEWKLRGLCPPRDTGVVTGSASMTDFSLKPSAPPLVMADSRALRACPAGEAFPATPKDRWRAVIDITKRIPMERRHPNNPRLCLYPQLVCSKL